MTMRYKVLLHQKAEEELNALYDTIAESAGPTTAWNFVSGIRTFCTQLSDFPERGTERVELMPGLRIIGYRRSVIINLIQRINDQPLLTLAVEQSDIFD
jgi:toxin ParE1/3/4